MNTIVGPLLQATIGHKIKNNFLTTLSKLKLYKWPANLRLNGAMLIPPGTYISKVRIKT